MSNSKRNSYQREWKRKNRDKVSASKKRYYSSPIGVFHKYREVAKRCGRNFDLEFELFNLCRMQKCHYCGKEQTKGNGIDRIDSSKGYNKDNILPCCRTCNVMKMAHSYSDFLKHISTIYKNLIKGK